MIIQNQDALHLQMREWRRDLHTHPETAFDEHRTAARVAQLLKFWGLAVETGIGKTGIVATLQGKRGSGSSIGLRADMDALPMQELNTFVHASQQTGKMHACGHDGHTAMLLGAAKYLADNPDFAGTVYFIFQPAEEGEGGAKEMIADGLFIRFPMQAVYGLHNWPALPLGHAAVHAGPVMAACDTFEIRLTGKGCHAAMPHQGIDSVMVAAYLVSALQTVVSRNVDPLRSAVISVTQIHAGDAWNIIPEEAVLRGTVRTFDTAVRQQIETRMKEIATTLPLAYGVSGKIDFYPGYPATVNTQSEARDCFECLRGLLGTERVQWNPDASMGAEDFSFMLGQKPGCYIWLGNGGEQHAHGLHSPHYDFNDDVLPLGASYWVRLVNMLLQGAAR